MATEDNGLILPDEDTDKILDEVIADTVSPPKPASNFADTHKYREALEAELQALAEEDDPDELLKRVKKLLVPELATITDNVIKIAKFGEPGQQLSAAKMVYQILGIVRAGKPATKANELSDLFKELANND